MANVVVDKLDDWQDDADAADSNLPGDDSNCDIASATSWVGNLRRIKSEVRTLSVNLGWQRYLGLSSAPSPDAPTYVNSTTFTLPNDWTSIATVGRRVKAIGSVMGTVYGTIKTSQVSGAVTTITLVMDAGQLLGATLDEVQFGVQDPAAAAALPTVELVGDDFVVPIEQGGTGNITGQPSGVASGDLSGTYPSPTVAKILNRPLGVAVPQADQRLTYDGAEWVPQADSTIQTLLGALTQNEIRTLLIERVMTGHLAQQGWIDIPLLDDVLGTATLTVQWFKISTPLTGGATATNIPAAYPKAFGTAVYAVVPVCVFNTDARVWVSWQENADLNQALLKAYNQGGTQTVSIYLLAIGR